MQHLFQMNSGSKLKVETQKWKFVMTSNIRFFWFWCKQWNWYDTRINTTKMERGWLVKAIIVIYKSNTRGWTGTKFERAIIVIYQCHYKSIAGTETQQSWGELLAKARALITAASSGAHLATIVHANIRWWGHWWLWWWWWWYSL